MDWEYQLRCGVDEDFKGKSDVMNCCCYRAMKFHEHGMKVMEDVT